MLGLPKSTELSKMLPKKAIYAKFQMNTAAKEKIDSDISRITIVNEISASKINIAEGTNVKSFFVMLVSLKKKEFDERNIITISKLIPQNMLMVLECDNEAKIAVYHSSLMQTDWKPKDELKIELKGLNLDAVWENIIVQIGGLSIEKGNTLDEQIAIDEKKAKLNKEIERIEKLARTEKQPKKKFELASQVKTLKKELDSLGGVPSVKAKPQIVKPEPKKEPIKQTEEEKAESPVPQETVKAISILPEYAAEIYDGFKTTEYRTWQTDYRGDLLICASSRKLKGCISGYAICIVELYDIQPLTVKEKRSFGLSADERMFGWKLRNVRQIVPFPYKGKLHLYDVDASLVKILSPIGTKEADKEWAEYYKPLLLEAGADYL